MARLHIAFFVVMISAAVLSTPLEGKAKSNDLEETSTGHSLWKRFINPEFALGSNADAGIGKMRTRRSTAEECEKLQLCKLHARSGRNFIAAFELYFVNKENAKLWDHRPHSIADCEQRYNCYEYRR